MQDWVLERLQQFVGRGDREDLEQRVEKALTRQQMGDHGSYRVVQNLPALARGLVVIEEGVVPEYARVRRVFHLTNAIVKYYYSPFYIEEQVPGYHARVAWSGGRQVAFTRDGRCCAFTSDRAPDFIPARFFADHPELAVGLTLGGKGIPYAKPAYRGEADDLEAWGTEIFELGVREPIATADKYALLEEYDIAAPPHVGPFEAGDLGDLEAWMKERNEAGSQGLLLKPSERHHRPLKYALPSAIQRAAPAWLSFEDGLEEDPYLQRLAQAACAATELGLEPESWDFEAVGRALLEPLAKAAAEVAAGKTLGEDFSVWLHRKEAAEELLAQLEERSAAGSIERQSLEPDGDGWRLRFRRLHPDATAALQRRLSGASYRD